MIDAAVNQPDPQPASVFDGLDIDAAIAQALIELEADPRADGESTHKQALIVQGALGMKKGKIGSQAAHASGKALLDRGVIRERPDGSRELAIPLDEHLKPWLNGAFTKICLKAVDERHLLSLYVKARHLGLPCALIRDNGLTQFNHQKTITAISVGPARKELVDLVTEGLSLL